MWHTLARLSHQNLNALIRHFAADAKPAGVTVLGILPGFMKTERVEMHLKGVNDEEKREYGYDKAESVEYSGRAVAALLRDPNVMRKAGQMAFVADLAEEYGFSDIDGRRIANFYRVMGLVP